MKRMDRHLRQVVATGDAAHEPALKDMKRRRQVQRDVAALRADEGAR